MHREVITQYSTELNRDMPIIAYGKKGYPVVVFPTQNSPCTNFEDFGMIDVMAPYIESGQIQVFCVDSVDTESWSDEAGDKAHRAQVQEAFYRYICNEALLDIHDYAGSEIRPLAIGCSMGATHSVIFALRRPDLFQGCIALSGVYDAHYFFGDWMDETLYYNSPTDFMPNMEPGHPLIQVYNQRELVLCVGQGAWEEDGIRTQRILDENFRRLGINAWCDYWGFDVNHDWPWWKKQLPYFLAVVLDELNG